MKKALILAVAATFMASSAFAVVSGSSHDMRTLSSTITGATAEVCVFCHTPHAGSANFPLWNRTTAALSLTQYSSDTLNAAPGGVVGDLQACLSCHDSTLIVNATLINGPGAGAGTTDDGLLATAVDSFSNISQDLSNDHPVGFVYDSSLSVTDGELNNPATDTAVAALLFGGEMWCSSCHDVHNQGTAGVFLRLSNANSDLCTTCHAK